MKITRNVDEWSWEDWEFVGRNIEQRDSDEELRQDRYYPMMLYAYPLDEEPSDQTVKEVHRKTNLTVVRDKHSHQYYLVLTACGMDLSQDIALAYIITENRIPTELAQGVSTQEGLTQGGDDFLKVMKECKRVLSGDSHKLSKIENAIEESNEVSE